MASEASISYRVAIRKTSSTLVLKNWSQSASFNADVSELTGPVPGSFNVGIGGKIVDLQEITTPGICWFKNMDATNYVTIGVWDPGIDVYYPMLELLAGESFPVRLYRHIQEEYTGTGTGTTGPGNYLFMKAVGGTVLVSVEAHGK